MMRAFRLIAGAVTVLMTLAGSARALEPDELLLIVNQNVPESRKLAEFYVNARRVPAGRILALPLPVGDDITQVAYERMLAGPVRAHLKEQGLAEQVTCLVTFYGVPLRVGPRMAGQAEQQEAAALETQRKKLGEELGKAVEELEKKALAADAAFRPATQPAGSQQLAADSPELLARRADAAYRALARRAEAAATPEERIAKSNELLKLMQALGGPASVVRAMAGHLASPQTPPEQRKALAALADQVQKAHDELLKLQQNPYDPAARARYRTLMAQTFGQIELLRAVSLQISYLMPGQSGAAVDSELALLWWPTYPRSNWQVNPLHHSAASERAHRMLMVSRLDAPQAGLVSAYILASLKAERDGLTGKMVIDTRNRPVEEGGPRLGSYGSYDQSLRDLAELLRKKTNLKVLLDESADVLPANSAEDVALYCGWYSLRNYVQSVKLNPGALGYHMASFELVSLREPNERGWVAGLLNDGAAVTMGPVAEPYLFAFPPPSEFFPLLLTGKLTLAECYWKTQATTSWQMALIGDPLYRPYKRNPPLAVEDLPVRLKRAVEEPATRPATGASGP